MGCESEGMRENGRGSSATTDRWSIDNEGWWVFGKQKWKKRKRKKKINKKNGRKKNGENRDGGTLTSRHWQWWWSLVGIWALGWAVGENKMEKKWAPVVHVCCGGGKKKWKNEVRKWGSMTGNQSWGVVREKKSRNGENGGPGKVIQLSALRKREEMEG